MGLIMNTRLLVSLFAGVVLLSPCAQAMDSNSFGDDDDTGGRTCTITSRPDSKTSKQSPLPTQESVSIDSKDAKVATEDSKVPKDAEVADVMQRAKTAIETAYEKSIKVCEVALERLENLRSLSGICKADYRAQKADYQTQIEKMHQDRAAMVAKTMALIKEAAEKGLESEAGQSLIALEALFCEQRELGTAAESPDSDSSNSSGDDSNA